MKLFRTLLLSSTIPLALTSVAAAQQADPLIADRDTVSFDAADLKIAPRGASRSERVRAFLSTKVDAQAADDLVLVEERVGRSGRVHQRFEQKIGGRRVYGANVTASFGEDGEMVRLHERVRRGADRRILPAGIDAQEALRIALAEHFPQAPVPRAATAEGVTTGFAPAAFFYDAPEVEEVLVARGRGALQTGFLVKAWSAETNELYHTLVDGRGKIVHVEDRTARDSYGIFPDHPGNSAQTVVQGPGAGNAQSPAGWLFSGSHSRFDISGNNVRAYLDTNNDNRPDGGGATVSNGNFTTAANLSGDPSTTQNREVAIQNLFYLNNRIHDVLYDHGFTESTGNFQEDNFGRGGRGSDSVNAEAQDGGGVNNANFATPSDGSNPRMQMYIWDLTNPRRDGDLDSDIVWHEYGHGLTWRMIGSMSGPISGAIGEGMADVLAILQNDDDRVGEYSANNSRGIRRARYTNYPYDLSNFTGQSVHSDGEIYAAAIWYLKGLFEQEGLTSGDLLDTLIEGMNFTAPGPDYMDMRNGILDAAPASQDCLVWEAFAQFGMGQGASMSSYSANASYSVPSTCSGGGGTPDPQPGTGPELSNIAAGTASIWWGYYWYAQTLLTVSEGGAPKSGVSVTFDWSGTAGSCTTDANGQCRVDSPTYRSSRVGYTTFTVRTIAGEAPTAASGIPLSFQVSRP
ncbi:M36 family metallopeptidase [Parvularcula oceani]|uniref:M36 family metallopeptidase n=1 Tax=Parvularcula oceani TaxID=1247963 RepID=UPI00069171B7|nr:M36 family metallopeptidase [Parvularcula oceani]